MVWGNIQESCKYRDKNEDVKGLSTYVRCFRWFEFMAYDKKR